MSEAEAKATSQPDPTEKLRELRDAYLAVWSKSLIETVNSEGYAKASGAALDGLLSVAAPIKEPVEQMMLKTLQQLKMPTSADFEGLAGRFTNIELLLDNLDGKLDRMEKLLTELSATPSEKPEMQTKSSAHGQEASQAEAISPKAGERVEAPRVARKTAQKKQTVLRAGETSKQARAVKQVQRNRRKE